jgi:hypothetical protein
MQFKTLKEAIDAGYEVVSKLPNGYILRTRIGGVWAMAKWEPGVNASVGVEAPLE